MNVLKRLVPTMLSCSLLLGCNNSPPVTTGSSTPLPPIKITASFPNGAPPLNQYAEFICTVKTLQMQGKDIGVSITLPDALKLESGNDSWTGDVAPNSEVIVVRTLVKSVKTGNYTIEINGSIDPTKNSNFGGTASFPIYISIMENFAEWRGNPAYGISVKPGGLTVVTGGSQDGRPTPPAITILPSPR